MLAWHNPTEAIGYATSRLEDAVDALHRLDDSPGPDRLQVAQEAINEATAAIVLVAHQRMGDALVTIEQLHAEHLGDQAAQPRRRCCQTYMAEPEHARGCATWGAFGSRVAMTAEPPSQGLAESITEQLTRQARRMAMAERRQGR